jgi:hypothetical protein
MDDYYVVWFLKSGHAYREKVSGIGKNALVSEYSQFLNESGPITLNTTEDETVVFLPSQVDHIIVISKNKFDSVAEEMAA